MIAVNKNMNADLTTKHAAIAAKRMRSIDGFHCERTMVNAATPTMSSSKIEKS